MNDTFGGHSVFFMSFIYCKTTSTPLISTFVKNMMINFHSLCYFCEIIAHFGFYPPKNPPMNIQSKQILCGLSRRYTRAWYKKKFVRILF